MASRRIAPKTIDEYIAAFPPEVQAILEKKKQPSQAMQELMSRPGRDE